MSIMIVRGPASHDRLIRGPEPLPREILGLLVARAADAGKTAALRACGCEQELLDALRVAERARVELVVIDPGTCADSPRLQTLLASLGCPHIQVRTGQGNSPAAVSPATFGRCIASVHGYGAQSYVLALSIALEHLGCESVRERYHVGT